MTQENLKHVELGQWPKIQTFVVQDLIFIQYNGRKYVETPALSSDFNAFKNLWSFLKIDGIDWNSG